MTLLGGRGGDVGLMLLSQGRPTVAPGGPPEGTNPHRNPAKWGGPRRGFRGPTASCSTI